MLHIIWLHYKKGPQIYVYSGQIPPLVGPNDQLFLQILFDGSPYKNVTKVFANVLSESIRWQHMCSPSPGTKLGLASG